MELTQAGATLYKYATEIMELHQVARRAVSDLIDLVTGKLVIGASLTLGEYVLPHLLAVFARRYPDVKYSVLIGNTEVTHERAREGTIDIGLVEGLVEDPQLDIKTFLEDELVLVAPRQHPLAAKKFVEKEDLKDCVFVIREEGSGTRLAVEEIFQKIDFRPSKIVTLGSTQAIKEAVEAGLGISVLSKWTLRKELLLGSIKTLRIKNINFSRGMYLLQHRDKFQSRACAEFVKFITSEKIPDLLMLKSE